MAVEIVGPFEQHVVVVDGRRVPYLTATPVRGGKVHLTLDDRIGLDVPVDALDQTVAFIADCIAVAAGYTCHPGEHEPRRRHPFPQVTGLSALG